MGSSRSELGDLLARVSELVAKQRAEFETGPVHVSATLEELRTALGGPTPETATANETVVSDLAARAAPGLLGIPGPRDFGFVIGGSHPAALAADWLTSGWDNNAGLYAAAPAAAVIEEIAARWLLDLLGLPPAASVGFVTGGMWPTSPRSPPRGTACSPTSAGMSWPGACPVHLPCASWSARSATRRSTSRSATWASATRRLERVPADEQGRMRADVLRDVLAHGDDAPLIVCAQAGNVNSGAFDPIARSARRPPRVTDVGARRRRVRSVGAPSPTTAAHLVDGVEPPIRGPPTRTSGSTSPTTAAIARAATLRRTTPRWRSRPSYLVQPAARARTCRSSGCPSSRAARAASPCMPSSARSAGKASRPDRPQLRAGAPVRRSALRPNPRSTSSTTSCSTRCSSASATPTTAPVPSSTACNATAPAGSGGTVWHGVAAMRISVSNWTTSEADVDASVDAILRVHNELRVGKGA